MVVAPVVPVVYHQRRRFGDELVMEEREVREGKRVTRKFGICLRIQLRRSLFYRLQARHPINGHNAIIDTCEFQVMTLNERDEQRGVDVNEWRNVSQNA